MDIDNIDLIVPAGRYRGTSILRKAMQMQNVLIDVDINSLCSFIEGNGIEHWEVQSMINSYC